jgi:uncharacterized membrane protein
MRKIVTVIICSVLTVFSGNIYAQSTGDLQTPELIEAKINKVLEEKPFRPEGSQATQIYQKLELFVTSGAMKGKTVVVENGNLPFANSQLYQAGDTVILTKASAPEGEMQYFITDYQRRDALGKLFFLFVILVIMIARWRGILSLVGMGVSFGVIFWFILPRLASGADPVWTAIYGSAIIIPATFFLSHGVNRKTSVAVAGTLIALVFTGFLAKAAVSAARLTGFASEEAGFLEAANRGVIDMPGLLLAGIIIGVLGVMDDITVSQSAIVFQLQKANASLKLPELFRRAMYVGQDHIASMVNTLILVYTGASLPLFVLFFNNPQPLGIVINHEIVADEIVRTLVGSCGLVLAVPVTTVMAALVAQGKEQV